MLNLSKSVLIKKQINLHLGWPEDEYIFKIKSFLAKLFFYLLLVKYHLSEWFKKKILSYCSLHPRENGVWNIS